MIALEGWQRTGKTRRSGLLCTDVCDFQGGFLKYAIEIDPNTFQVLTPKTSIN
jgi:hypothetical protein